MSDRSERRHDRRAHRCCDRAPDEAAHLGPLCTSGAPRVVSDRHVSRACGAAHAPRPDTPCLFVLSVSDVPKVNVTRSPCDRVSW